MTGTGDGSGRRLDGHRCTPIHGLHSDSYWPRRHGGGSVAEADIDIAAAAALAVAVLDEVSAAAASAAGEGDGVPRGKSRGADEAAPPLGHHVALAAPPVGVPELPQSAAAVLEAQLRPGAGSREEPLRVLLRHHQTVELANIARRQHLVEHVLPLHPMAWLAAAAATLLVEILTYSSLLVQIVFLVFFLNFLSVLYQCAQAQVHVHGINWLGRFSLALARYIAQDLGNVLGGFS